MIYNYSKYGGSYALLIEEEERQSLPHVTFERDQIEAERQQQEQVNNNSHVALSALLLLLFIIY